MQTTLRTFGASCLALVGTLGLADAQNCPQGMVCTPQPTMTQERVVGPEQVGAPQNSAFFTRFNTFGGTRQLLSVRVTTEATIDYTAEMENRFESAGQTIVLQASPTIVVQDAVNQGGMGHVFDLDPMSPGNELGFAVTIQESRDLGPFDGVDDAMGTSGVTINDSATQGATTLMTGAMDLARFTLGSGSGPAGGVFINVDTANPNPTCMSPNDNSCGLLTQATVTVTVEYNYCICTVVEECIEKNRRQPGSLLLFPEYRNGPGQVTVYTVTNTNCEFFDGGVDVEFRYIDGDSCLESNQAETLTPCDTITLLTSSHVGSDQGYAYAYARDSAQTSPVNAAGTPIVFNHLVGSLLVVDGWKSLEYSINAVSFKGVGDEGTSTDRESPGPVAGVTGDGIRDLDGVEYEEAPDKILIPRFLGQDPVLQKRGLHSDLILIALSGGRLFEASAANPGGGTTILINGWNDNEVIFSLEHTFDCWQKLRLGLLQSGDLVTPVPGTTAFDNDTLDDFFDDPDEIAGANGLESGWFWIDGLVASSTAESITDPAVYAVLIETIRGRSAADLPFEYCSQKNGDLLPGSILGDFNSAANPPQNNMDNQ